MFFIDSCLATRVGCWLWWGNCVANLVVWVAMQTKWSCNMATLSNIHLCFHTNLAYILDCFLSYARRKYTNTTPVILLETSFTYSDCWIHDMNIKKEYKPSGERAYNIYYKGQFEVFAGVHKICYPVDGKMQQTSMIFSYPLPRQSRRVKSSAKSLL